MNISPPRDDSASSPRDVFLQLFSIVSLYIITVAFGALCFQYIDLFFPDPLDHYSFGAVAGVVRGAMAALIIVFPIYLFLALFLYREERTHPEKREGRLRKWLIYFTLFVAAAIITGDLIGLVYSFLEGDLTMRFVLKIFTMLAIAVTVFVYYFSLVRVEWYEATLRLFVWGVAFVVFGCVVAGFFTAGSPFLARKLRFDERRVNDLQTLQSAIVNYWQQKEALPLVLADLRDDISGFSVLPLDPKTNAPYDYRVLAPLRFELCAAFELSSQLGERAYRAMPYPYVNETWDHDAGRVCFGRTIDPDLYKLFPRK